MSREPVLRLETELWAVLTAELHRRTENRHESGAFLLGRKDTAGCTVGEVVYYDELDPDAYETGVCVLHGNAFARLWALCGQRGLSVVADVHVHPFEAWQSLSDRHNPMIARAGHLAMILPNFARAPVELRSVGVYEYLGSHRWRMHAPSIVRLVEKEELT